MYGITPKNDLFHFAKLVLSLFHKFGLKKVDDNKTSFMIQNSKVNAALPV